MAEFFGLEIPYSVIVDFLGDNLTKIIIWSIVAAWMGLNFVYGAFKQSATWRNLPKSEKFVIYFLVGPITYVLVLLAKYLWYVVWLPRIGNVSEIYPYTPYDFAYTFLIVVFFTLLMGEKDTISKRSRATMAAEYFILIAHLILGVFYICAGVLFLAISSLIVVYPIILRQAPLSFLLPIMGLFGIWHGWKIFIGEIRTHFVRTKKIPVKTEKKRNCNICKKKVGSLGFRCKYCDKDHCSEHRLPEDHKCTGEPKSPPKRPN